jgi:hypothetical protein
MAPRIHAEWGLVGLGYYLVLAGMVMLILAVSFVAGLIVYKVINNAANADTIGFIKSVVILAVAIFLIGLILP